MSDDQYQTTNIPRPHGITHDAAVRHVVPSAAEGDRGKTTLQSLEEKLAQLEAEVSSLLAERASIDRQRRDLKQQMEKIYRVGAARMVWEADRLRNQRRWSGGNLGEIVP